MNHVNRLFIFFLNALIFNALDVSAQAVMVPNNGGGNPFYLWAHGNTQALSHMRIGTDYSHIGDAAIEIFQHYANPSPPDPGRVIVNGFLGVGTLYPSERLSVNGKIKAKEVNVSTAGWADHVFRSEYELMSLSQLRAFISRHGHLPNIPTEEEVFEKGVNLSEMTVKLLEKVEELTIYLVQQQDRIGELENEVARLKSCGGK